MGIRVTVLMSLLKNTPIKNQKPQTQSWKGFVCVQVMRAGACCRKQTRPCPSETLMHRIHAHIACARVEEWPWRDTTVLAVDEDDPDPPDPPDDNWKTQLVRVFKEN